MNLKLLSILSLTTIISITGMDNPHPEKFSTPQKVRVQIYQTMHDIIEGPDQESDYTQISPRLWQESPQSFSKGLRHVFEHRFEQKLIKKGITPELVAQLIPEATQMLKEECKTVPSTPVKPHLKRQMSEVARAMKVGSPECKSARLDNPGFCMGELVLIDEEHLHYEAPTPRRVKAILAHEMRHRLNRDRVKHDATLMASDVVGAPLSPELIRKKIRETEAFADFEASTAAPEFAYAARRLTRDAHEMYGDGHADSHPSNKQRRILAELSCNLHEQEPKRLVVKRNLSKDFKDIWNE